MERDRGGEIERERERGSWNSSICTAKGEYPDKKVGGGTDWCVTQPFSAGGLGAL